MQINVALRGRTRLAALLHQLEQEAGQREQGERCDRRNRWTWRQLILGVLVARSTRLVALARVVAPKRRVGEAAARWDARGPAARPSTAPEDPGCAP
jgi:hypothetical protein